jgi:tRNA pseudouridine55 synthase
MSVASVDGLVVVDKPGGMTSHDVVSRVRRLAGTRKVGHAGTLDPMATGVLLVGVGRATRLLGPFAAGDKAYDATVRLGMATVTDDAEGEVIEEHDASGVDRAAVEREVAHLTGDLLQVPSTVSAVKVDGKRAYQRVREGEAVELAARPVTVSCFDVLDVRRLGRVVDVDVRVEVSSGTYVRALARDLGAALGVGGHLTALRRTRVGRFDQAQARTLDQLAEQLVVVDLDALVSQAFPRRDVAEREAAEVRHGRPLRRDGETGPVGVFGPDGHGLALMVPSPRPGEEHLLRVQVGLAGTSTAPARGPGAAGTVEGPGEGLAQ